MARSTRVTGRTPFGREEELDYEVESEWDWEEEEDPGESLSDVEEEGEEGGEEGEEEEMDGFCVADGYLSADEGAASMDVEGAQAADEEGEEAGTVAIGSEERDTSSQGLRKLQVPPAHRSPHPPALLPSSFIPISSMLYFFLKTLTIRE